MFVMPVVAVVAMVMLLFHDDHGPRIRGGGHESAEADEAGEEESEMAFHRVGFVRGCAFGRDEG